MGREHEILIPLAPEGRDKYHTHVQVQVQYHKGDNYISALAGATRRRGYYLSAGLVGIEVRQVPDGRGGTVPMESRAFGIASHPTVLLEPTARLSRKRLDGLFRAAAADVFARAGQVARLIGQALAADAEQSGFLRTPEWPAAPAAS